MIFRRVFLLGAGCAALAGCVRHNTVSELKDAARSIRDEQDRLSVQSAILSFADAAELAGYFRDSYGVALFPSVAKGAVGVGGAHGRGWVFRKGELTGEATITQITIGLQLGGQVFSQIIFFEDEDTYRDFTSSNFELGAQASAVALMVGANAQTSTTGGASAGAGDRQAKRAYTDGVAVFIKAKAGLMYEASVGGEKFTYRALN